MSNELTKRLAGAGYRLSLTEEAKLKIADVGYDPEYGARPLRRALQKHVEDRLSEELLKGTGSDRRQSNRRCGRWGICRQDKMASEEEVM